MVAYGVVAERVLSKRDGQQSEIVLMRDSSLRNSGSSVSATVASARAKGLMVPVRRHDVHGHEREEVEGGHGLPSCASQDSRERRPRMRRHIDPSPLGIEHRSRCSGLRRLRHRRRSPPGNIPHETHNHLARDHRPPRFSHAISRSLRSMSRRRRAFSARSSVRCLSTCIRLVTRASCARTEQNRPLQGHGPARG